MRAEFEKQTLQPAFRISALINASYYTLPDDFSFEGETHDFWEMSYVDRGQVAVQLGENSYLLKVGEMLFYRPNTFHSSRVWQGKPAALVNIAFEVEGNVPETLENEIMVLRAEESQCMAAIMREASRAYVHFENMPGQVRMETDYNAPYGSQQIICNRLEELMIYACRGDRNIRMDRRLITANLHPSGESIVGAVRLYLQEHYSEKLTLEKIAHAHCMSTTKLKRVFREETGNSVMAYLSGLRIKEAKRMVRQGALNFSQIAELTGFESIYYFSSVFKKHTGMTLTEYARSLRGENE